MHVNKGNKKRKKNSNKFAEYECDAHMKPLTTIAFSGFYSIIFGEISI